MSGRAARLQVRLDLNPSSHHTATPCDRATAVSAPGGLTWWLVAPAPESERLRRERARLRGRLRELEAAANHRLAIRVSRRAKP